VADFIYAESQPHNAITNFSRDPAPMAFKHHYFICHQHLQIKENNFNQTLLLIREINIKA